MLNNASLKKKLLFSSGASSLALLLVGVCGLYSLNKVNTIYSTVAEVHLPNIEGLTSVESAVQGVQIAANSIKGDHVTPERLATILKETQETLERIEKSGKLYESTPFAEGEKELWEKTKTSYKLVLDLSQEAFKLSKSGLPADEKKRDLLLEEPYHAADVAFQDAIDANEDFVTKMADEASKKASETAHFAFWSVIIGMFSGMVISLYIGYALARSLSNTLTNATERLSKGAQEVAGASTQIAEAGTELSSSATEQAAALQQTVASLEEVSAMVNKSADNAQRSLQTSTQSQEAATRGKHAVNDMIHAIEDISRSNTDIVQQIETSNREISDIVKVIGEIGNKTKVINDIVFQTKLLSFNASVEAARAGEHGKGFAVVAEEVGNLAQMSGNAAKEISGMLEESMRKVERIVHDTKTKVEHLVTIGRQKVETGSTTAKQCGSVLEELVTSVSQVNQMVGEIATACQEQAQGVQEINKAMGQLDQVTQQNASASQQAATSAEELQNQTSELRSVVNDLNHAVMGGQPLASGRTFKEPSAKTVKNVIALERKAQEKRATQVAHTAPAKRVSGSDVVPSEDDPRFEDI